MARTSVPIFTLPAIFRLDLWVEASFHFSRRRPLGAVGAAIIGLMIVVAVLAGFISPYDPLATDYGKLLQAPSSSHWFGTLSVETYSPASFTARGLLYGSGSRLRSWGQPLER
jgi:hypothetical protein